MRKRSWSGIRNSTIYFVILVLFYCLASSQAVQAFAYRWTTVADHPEYSLEKVLNQETPKPYAYRVLMPWLITKLAGKLPEAVTEKILQRSQLTLNANLGNKAVLLNEATTIGYGLVLLTGFIFLSLTLLILRELGYETLIGKSDQSNLAVDVAPILFALFLAIIYRPHNGFIYDHLELLLISAYLLATIKEARLIYVLPLLMIAVLNKETAIFFPLIGAAVAFAKFKNQFLARRLGHFVAQFGTVLLGLILVRITKLEVPGGPGEWHFFGNLEFWTSVQPYLSFTTPHTQIIPLPKPTNLILAIALCTVFVWSWKRATKTIKLVSLATAIINIPLFLLFCYRDEFRNLSLMYPAIYLTFTNSLLLHYNKGLHQNDG